MIESPFVTPREIGERLLLGRQGVAQVIDQLPHLRIGPNIVRIERDAFERWLAERRVDPTI
jgi:hypothetical protein